jgi:hypothetical protein
MRLEGAKNTLSAPNPRSWTKRLYTDETTCGEIKEITVGVEIAA